MREKIKRDRKWKTKSISVNFNITPPFKVFSLEKLTSIFASSFLTSLDTYSQTFHCPIYIISLLYTSLVTPPS